MNRDERIDLARWLWDVGTSGRCKTLEDSAQAMQLGEDVMQKLSQDLMAKAEEMRNGQVHPTQG
jgi:hypothetical protein